MPDEEQCPTGSDAGRQAPHHLFDRSGDVHVEADNEVMVGWSRRPHRKIGLDPVDAPREVRPHGVGCRAGIGQSRRGEIDRRDLPPARRKPERLRAMAAARIDRTSGTQLADLSDQLGVRRPLRDTIAVLAQNPRPPVFPSVPVVSGQDRALSAAEEPALIGCSGRGALANIGTADQPHA